MLYPANPLLDYSYYYTSLAFELEMLRKEALKSRGDEKLYLVIKLFEKINEMKWANLHKLAKSAIKG